MRGDKCHIAHEGMNLVIEETRPRGRPRIRWLDKLKTDLKEASARAGNAQNKARREPKRYVKRTTWDDSSRPCNAAR